MKTPIVGWIATVISPDGREVNYQVSRQHEDSYYISLGSSEKDIRIVQGNKCWTIQQNPTYCIRFSSPYYFVIVAIPIERTINNITLKSIEYGLSGPYDTSEKAKSAMQILGSRLPEPHRSNEYIYILMSTSPDLNLYDPINTSLNSLPRFSV